MEPEPPASSLLVVTLHHDDLDRPAGGRRPPMSRRSALVGLGTAAFGATAAGCGCAVAPAPSGRIAPGPWVPGAANQLVTATAVGNAGGRTTATSGVLRAWQRSSGGWNQVLETSCRFGRSGIHPSRTEGDGTTPAGIFTLGTTDATAFGHFARPSGLKVPWRPITTDSYWVGDGDSSWYNRWYEGDPGGRFDPRESEHLRTVSGVGTSDFYGLALSIGFNTGAIPNFGSAIFLHLTHQRAPSGTTAGCVAIDQTPMRRLLGWLDAAHSPHIAIGTWDWLHRR